MGFVAQWLESWTPNRKVVSSSLGPAGIVGGGSECPALSPPSIPRLRLDPWARHRTLNCSPGAVAAHRSGCVFTAVCAHFGWVNAEHKFRVLGHHTWPYVTSLYYYFYKVCQGACWCFFLYTCLNVAKHRSVNDEFAKYLLTLRPSKMK